MHTSCCLIKEYIHDLAKCFLHGYIFFIACATSLSCTKLVCADIVSAEKSSLQRITDLIEKNSAQLSSKQYKIDMSYRSARQKLIGYVPHIAFQSLWQTSGSWPTVPYQQTSLRVDQLIFDGYGPIEHYNQGLYDMRAEQAGWSVERNDLFFESAQKTIAFSRQNTIQEYSAAKTFFAELDSDRAVLAKNSGLATVVQEDLARANAAQQETLLKQPQRNRDALVRELWTITNMPFDFAPLYDFDAKRAFVDRVLQQETVTSLTGRAKQYNPFMDVLNQRIEKADYTARVLPRAYLPKVGGYYTTLDQKVPIQLDYLDFPRQWSLGIALEWEFDGWKHIDDRDIAKVEKLQLECERLQTVNTFEKDITESYATIANLAEQISEKEKIIQAQIQAYEQQKAFLSVGLASCIDEADAYTKVKSTQDERNELSAKMAVEYETIQLISGFTLE
jgi:outer membrane protein TolC